MEPIDPVRPPRAEEQRATVKNDVQSIDAAPAATEGLTVLRLCTRRTSLVMDASMKGVCPRCEKKGVMLCPECALPVTGVTLPQVTMPLHLDLLRDLREPLSKSSSPYLQTLAPAQTRLFVLPAFPAYSAAATSASAAPRALFLFPSPTSRSVRQLPDLSVFTHLCVLDCAWQRVSSCMGQPTFDAASMTHVHISEYATLFWRYQDFGRACVSTNEAVYFFMREFLVELKRRAALQEWDLFNPADGAAPPAIPKQTLESMHPADPDNLLYDGSLDDLMCIFLAKQQRVQHEYTDGLRKGALPESRLTVNYAHLMPDAASAAAAPLAGRKRIRGSQVVRVDVVSADAAAIMNRHKMPRRVHAAADAAADGTHGSAADVGQAVEAAVEAVIE